MVPCRVKRKQATKRRQKKNILRTGFKVVDAGTADYYGFTLTGDGRYVMGDFTVTHNTGKTVVSARLPAVLAQWKGGRSRGRMMFLVHRDELATQAADTFSSMNPNLVVGIEKADSYASANADIVIGSVQTLGPDTKGALNRRLATFNPSTFDMIEIDECHHAAKGKYYHAILNYMRALKGQPNRDPQVLHLGVTATPGRSDNEGLECLYDAISYTYDIRDGIAENWLVEPHVYRAETTVDISKVASGPAEGGLNLAQLEHAINTPERNQMVADKYLEICRLESMAEPISNIGQWKKDHAVIVDFVDVSGRHELVTCPTLFGLRNKFDAEGKSIVKAEKAIRSLEEKNPGLDLRSEATSMAGIEATLRRVDVLRPVEVPPEVRKYTSLPWVKDGRGGLYLSLPSGAALSIREDGLGHFELSSHNNGVRRALHMAASLKEACFEGDKNTPTRDKDMLRSDAAWRSTPPSEAQALLLFQKSREVKKSFTTAQAFYEHCRRRFKAGDASFSKGAISDQINKAKAMRA